MKIEKEIRGKIIYVLFNYFFQCFCIVLYDNIKIFIHPFKFLVYKNKCMTAERILKAFLSQERLSF